MDRIQLVSRQFRRIQPQPCLDWTRFPAREIEAWLRNDLLPVVDEFSKRPAFREYATWPLRVLVAGVGTPERRAVEDVDAALVTSASCLNRLGQSKRLARRIQAKNKSSSVKEAMISPEDGKKVDETVILQNRIRYMATRPWIDLVCADDYFYPYSEMNYCLKPRVQDGMFVVGYNPELGTVGDFVTRSLLWRIKQHVDSLLRYRRLCHGALVNRSTYARKINAENEAWSILQSRVDELRVICAAGPEASLRDSCVILTQVYADFHPSPDLNWLGLPKWTITTGSGLLRHRILHQRHTATVDRIATAIEDLNRLYPVGDAEKSALDEAVATAGLVLVETPRTVYWDTKRIDVDWTRFDQLWQLLHALTSKARLQAAVEVKDVYADRAVTDSALSTLIGRLKKKLPVGLWRLIQATGQRSYRFHLDHKRIHLFKS